jgi:hypothetical protein
MPGKPPDIKSSAIFWNCYNNSERADLHAPQKTYILRDENAKTMFLWNMVTEHNLINFSHVTYDIFNIFTVVDLYEGGRDSANNITGNF